MIVMISGHMDLTEKEFDQYYKPAIIKYAEQKATFIVGGAEGTDKFAQQLLSKLIEAH